ncbi:MAG: hypothetical protein ACRDPB_01120 [Nocardioidaceae bacterium]
MSTPVRMFLSCDMEGVAEVASWEKGVKRTGTRTVTIAGEARGEVKPRSWR